MKIFILPVDNILQPNSQPYNYPRHNNSYGIEQDFYKYLLSKTDLITDKSKNADYHYLPVFWTRWHMNHKKVPAGFDELSSLVSQVILDDSKTFTICQHMLGPAIELGKTVIFFGSRKETNGIDVPLICRPHQIPLKKPFKKYLASFTGTYKSHPIREEMVKLLKNSEDFYFYDGNKGSEFFVQKLLESYIALCPRGYGGSSFRFFESMQLGVVPFLISDFDVRPFKKYINWEKYSFFTSDLKTVGRIISKTSKRTLLAMGSKCAELWKKELTYGKWCKYVIKELGDLQRREYSKTSKQL